MVGFRLTLLRSRDTVSESKMTVKQHKSLPKEHCWIYKASWRGTALRLRIEANDLEYAWKMAENTIRRMLGGASCLSLDLLSQEY